MIEQAIQDYSERHTSGESDLLRELREKTYSERDDKSMLSGFYQGRLLSMFSRIVGPRRVLEIGTYMGYSAICLAEGLTSDGKIITIDINEETNATAEEFWRRAGLEDRIDALIGEAVDLIPEMDEVFDLVFIDADKENYLNYFDLVFPKTRIGGLIIADNVLWSGDVLNAESGLEVKESTQALYEYSLKINGDERVSNLLLAVRDGLMIARKETD